MNKHLAKDVSRETHFRPNEPWITNENYIKLYMLEHLDNIKLSTCQYIVTSIINHSPYMNDIFPYKTSPISFTDNLLM